jgi:hypothetical protein
MEQVPMQMEQVQFYAWNLRQQKRVEGRYAAQVPALFWNLHRLH